METLEIYSEQEKQKQREAEAKFAKLKDKYQATEYPDKSVSSPLFSILEKLETETILDKSELDLLQENQLTEAFSIAQKQKQNKENEENEVKRLEDELLALKAKYKVPKNVEYSFCINYFLNLILKIN
ncbi:hypothetical protein [Okeania sp. KiyG1]|uniref:hypothetical protein n=1 Tax=Okeania sp. KiyG1 TaxID=2720165 RepID=UPI001924A251|nr:hypothetical protein [Okeania sp. KiyG1]GGA28143.1 hypothetical protein CYANOKiyG1_44350 [Okeania sp. KiyG1]